MKNIRLVKFNNQRRPSSGFDLVKLEELLARGILDELTELHKVEFYHILIITQGPEYPANIQRIKINAGNNKVEVLLEHKLNMPAKGWYSGDVHNHLSRPNASYNANQMAHARAADLHN